MKWNLSLTENTPFDSFINDLLGRSRRKTSTGGFDDFNGGFRSQAPAPDTDSGSDRVVLRDCG
ncbi:hypothetical protein [aff. Roholtiella sp. LEGE 12411]|uniref:hypothetical protein n=1 Tax=aff. Roholtiella sp. LEGE 12411 TaxID=1828822 RepID=UPI001FC7D296|nr:hypothetical protein [aff. Roholtiella sp. LEGE 12411]